MVLAKKRFVKFRSRFASSLIAALFSARPGRGHQAHLPFVGAPVPRIPVFPRVRPTVRASPVSNNSLEKFEAVRPRGCRWDLTRSPAHRPVYVCAFGIKERFRGGGPFPLRWQHEEQGHHLASGESRPVSYNPHWREAVSGSGFVNSTAKVKIQSELSPTASLTSSPFADAPYRIERRANHARTALDTMSVDTQDRHSSWCSYRLSNPILRCQIDEGGFTAGSR